MHYSINYNKSVNYVLDFGLDFHLFLLCTTYLYPYSEQKQK